MNKQVFSIECKNYLHKNKVLPYVDGILFSSEKNSTNGNYSYRVSDLDSSLGEFFSIKVNEKNKIEISTDFCGFYPLFWKKKYFKGKERVLISNCFHSLAAYSESKLEVKKIIPNILSKNQIFIQDYSNSTSLRDIHRLGWNELIEISADGVKVKKEDNIVSDSYMSLIAKGVEKSQRALELIGQKKSLNLYLSGGKDSRAILALLLSIGISPKCTTQNPNSYKGKAREVVEKDFNIASFFVARYGLDWFQTMSKSAVKISFEESLEQHAFYRSGYYLFSPSQYIVYDNNRVDEVQLRGGGGGLFKSTWGEYIKNSYVNKKIIGRPETVTDDATTVYNELAPRRGIKKSIYLEAQDCFLNSIHEISSQNNFFDIYSVLDEHYIGYRNRSHFGHVRNSSSQGKMVFYPLINEYFYNAALMLSSQEKAQGKLIFDIIEYCAPELNEYPYDDGHHELLPCARDRKDLKLDPLGINSYNDAQKNNKNALKGIFKGEAFDSNLEELQFIEKSMNEIIEVVGRDLCSTDNEFFSYIDSLKEDKKFRGKLCSVLASVPTEANKNFSKGHFYSRLEA